MVNLMMRFYDPQEGKVELDGLDLKDLCLKDVRRQIGSVQQQTELFGGTIEDNITYGLEPGSWTREDVIAAGMTWLTLSLTLTHSHSHSFSLCLSLSLSHAFSVSITHSLSHSLTHSLTHSHYFAHTTPSQQKMHQPMISLKLSLKGIKPGSEREVVS